jgi:hypothetical protein
MGRESVDIDMVDNPHGTKEKPREDLPDGTRHLTHAEFRSFYWRKKGIWNCTFILLASVPVLCAVALLWGVYIVPSLTLFDHEFNGTVVRASISFFVFILWSFLLYAVIVSYKRLKRSMVD